MRAETQVVAVLLCQDVAFCHPERSLSQAVLNLDNTELLLKRTRYGQEMVSIAKQALAKNSRLMQKARAGQVG